MPSDEEPQANGAVSQAEVHTSHRPNLRHKLVDDGRQIVVDFSYENSVSPAAGNSLAQFLNAS